VSTGPYLLGFAVAKMLFYLCRMEGCVGGVFEW